MPENPTSKMPGTAEHLAEDDTRLKRRERWKSENERAIEAWNHWIDENGIPFAELRPW